MTPEELIYKYEKKPNWVHILEGWVGRPDPNYEIECVNTLILRGALRPVEDELAECQSEAPSKPYDPQVALAERRRRNMEPAALAERLGRAFDEIATLRANHTARIDDAHARLDAAEAEIKALRKRDAEIIEKVAALFCATWAKAKL